MAIDYSKWDKIELSDDSDIEVHPNVDKRSFIRWKQQDIHQKRIQRNQDIHTFEIQIPMYEELNKRVNKLLKDNTDEQLGDFEGIKKYLKTTFDDSKPNGVEDDASTYNEMIEDLFVQLKSQLEKDRQDPNNGTSLRFQVENHVKKIEDVLTQQREKLQTLYKERELHISSEDIHTGFDRSFLNKGDSASTSAQSATTASTSCSASTPTTTSSYSASASLTPATNTSSSSTIEADSKKNTTTTQTETAVAKTQGSNNVPVTDEDDEEEIHDLEDIHPDTLKLSQFSTSAIPKITEFLKTHTHIITPQQKDSLLMKAFDSQLAGDEQRTKQIVFFSTLIQYIYDVVSYKKASHPTEIAIVVEQFSSKLFGNNTNNPLLSSFLTEIGNVTKHIETRCKVLAQESAEKGEGVETIQLKSLDDNAQLIVNLPDPNSEDPAEKERYEIFKTLPQKMQDALKTESLDAVNRVFETLPIEESEHILEIFEQGEIIGLEAVLENEQDWNELKDGYSKAQREEAGEGSSSNQAEKPKIESLSIDDEGPTYTETADIVD